LYGRIKPSEVRNNYKTTDGNLNFVTVMAAKPMIINERGYEL